MFMSGAPRRALLACTVVWLATASAVRADTYPSRSITIMPLLAAGTGLDVTVRLYADRLSQAFGVFLLVVGTRMLYRALA